MRNWPITAASNTSKTLIPAPPFPHSIMTERISNTHNISIEMGGGGGGGEDRFLTMLWSRLSVSKIRDSVLKC